MTSLNIKIKRLSPDAVMPYKAHESDAGFDLVAVEDAVIEPGETVIVKTGIAVALPIGYELQVRPRSGVSSKTKLRVANAPGTVDAGYRGEIGVIIDNIYRAGRCPRPYSLDLKGRYVEEGTEGSYIVRKGDRIAQAVVQKLPRVEFIEVDELDESDRGSTGFGGSGV